LLEKIGGALREDIYDTNGETMIHVAAKLGHVEIIMVRVKVNLIAINEQSKCKS
jgi:phosphoribosylformylglycinamidine (FGAM) synthase PurS component